MFISCTKNILFIVLMIILSGGAIFGQTSGFTYQGRLTDGGTPANGSYDLQIALFDSAGGSTQIGPTQSIPNVAVSGGVFTVTLDFGQEAFTGGSRFLEISMRPSGAAAFITLTPRQQISATPYAVRSLNAANAQQLDGVAASQYVKTDDTRLSDARDPKVGSSNYVQNTNSLQANTNFNITGNGTAGGTLSGNTVNAATQYNLGGQPVVSVSAQNILKLGNTGNVAIGPSLVPAYKLDVESDANGLRVGTATPGGIGMSLGVNGRFEIDSNGAQAGRFVVKEDGNVGIGTGIHGVPSKLSVNGTVESITGGFKFPDGSTQSSAINPSIGKIVSGRLFQEVEIGRSSGGIPVVSITLLPGIYLLTATVQLENRASDFFGGQSRHVTCTLGTESWTNHLGKPGDPMDSMAVTMHSIFNQQSGQNPQVSLSCGTSEAGGQVFAKMRRLTAMRVADNPQGF